MAITVAGTSYVAPVGLVDITPANSTVFLPKPSQLAIGHFYVIVMFVSGLTGPNNNDNPVGDWTRLFKTSGTDERAVAVHGRYITTQAQLDDAASTKIMAGASSTRVTAIGLALSGVDPAQALLGASAVNSFANTTTSTISVPAVTGTGWRLGVLATTITGDTGGTDATPTGGTTITARKNFAGPGATQGTSSTLHLTSGGTTSFAMSPAPLHGTTFQLLLKEAGGTGPVEPDPPYGNRLGIAPSDKRPVITFGTLTAGEAPPITSDGWMREKRVGASENIPGSGQTSTADLDMTGSSRFAYPVTPPTPANAANPANYVITDFKPGGEAQAAKWLFNVSFVVRNTRNVVLRLRSSTANPSLGMVYINGQRIADEAPRADGIGAGVGYYAKLTFPTKGDYIITIYGLNGSSGGFGGVAVDVGGTVKKPTPITEKVIAFIGDSFVNGSGAPPTGAGAVETFVWRLGWLMGATTILQAGIGGTGWVKEIGSDPSSTFQGRLDAVLAFNPDVIVFAGGRNDNAGIASIVYETLQTAGAAADVYVVPTATDSQTTVRNEMQAASQGYVYVDIPQAGIELGADGIHPTFQGHRDLAEQAWAWIVDAPPPEPGTALTARVVIERSVDGGVTWEYVAEVTRSAQMLDFESLSFGVTLYRATAYSMEGATASTTITVIADSGAVWLSGGEGFGVTGRLPLDPKISISAGRARALKQYAGRTRPVPIAGEALNRVVTAAGSTSDLEDDTASSGRLTEIAQQEHPVHMFRDPDGHRIYGMLSDINLPREGSEWHPAGWNSLWGYSFTMTETDREA